MILNVPHAGTKGRQFMSKYSLLTWASLGCALLAGPLPRAVRAADRTAAEQAQRLLAAAGVQGGLVVHVGCGDGKLTAALHAGDSYLVHGLDTDPVRVAKARAYVRSLGVYGPVSVDAFDGSHLPYDDNMVNLAVVSEPHTVPMAEVLRALAPGGVAQVWRDGDWARTVKPPAKQMDEWTHYLHDASNNAVSSDRLVAPPRQLRWVAGPRWVRHHDYMASLTAMVSAGGRLFYLFDEGATCSMQYPARWAVIARDAFNGTVLWKRRIEKWHPTMWPGKHGPAQLPRRLVAHGRRVYVPLGADAPLTALDAATGKTIRTYPQTAATEEVLFRDGVLYLVVNPNPTDFTDTSFAALLHRSGEPALKSFVRPPPPPAPPKHKQPFQDVTGKRSILAIDAESGQIKWTCESTFLQLTLAVDDGRAYFHDGERVICLARGGGGGKRLWASEPIRRNMQMHAGFSATLVVHDGVVLFSGAENMQFGRGAKDTITALDARTGKKLWSAPHPPSGYTSPEDTFVVNGLVWTAPTTNRNDSGTFTGRDLRTGQVRATFPADDGRHMPHHRCHRAKATERFFLMSRTGIELVDPIKKHWERHDWVRGSCQYGIMPANGLIYAPPHSCSCYVESKLDGLCALTATRATLPKPTARLTPGPVNPQSVPARRDNPQSGAWPIYRGNPQRTGTATTSVPAKLKPRWRTTLGGRLSPVTIADGRLLVASIDTHTVHALDADSGRQLWHFTAGGRIDSPPTLCRGLAVFGSADGCVYCLRAADGAMAWRFRAVPVDRRIVAFGQLESQWPIHGSVLIREGVVHCVAGRSMFLDGGLRYLRLDAATGKLLSENVMDDRDPKTGRTLDANVRWPDLPVALPDILSCDGRHIYMRRQLFNLEGRRLPQTAPHLYSPTGFLDGGAWWHRTYWLYAPAFGYATGYKAPASRGPAGRILVMDETNVYGFAAKPPHLYRGWTMGWYEYQLFAMKKSPTKTRALAGQPIHFLRRRGAQPKQWPKYTWTRDLPCLVRAMVLCGQTLFVAGPPRILDERESMLTPDLPAIRKAAESQEAALAGHRGALLVAIRATDGTTLSSLPLDSPPTWDALAAARGHLYLSTLASSVVCLHADQP